MTYIAIRTFIPQAILHMVAQRLADNCTVSMRLMSLET